MSYAVILSNRYDVRDFVEELTLEDSLDEIAYKASIRLAVTSELPAVVPGHAIRVTGIPFGGDGVANLLHPGVVWECTSANSGSKHLSVTAYDRTIYLAKSEDERLLPGGQTASERLKLYAKDWGIPVGTVQNTVIKLARNIKRTQSIYAMIQEDLKETADKGGGLFRPRMTERGLELVKLGGNRTKWPLELLEDVSQTRSLEGAVTQVKVLGAEAGEKKLSPVLALERKDAEKLGTLQKIIQDSKLETAGEAKQAAQKALLGVQTTFSVNAPDINVIRAGDEVRLNGIALWVTRVSHKLGTPGHMELELAPPEKVRRDYLA